MHQIFQTGDNPWRGDSSDLLTFVLVFAAIVAVMFSLACFVGMFAPKLKRRPRRTPPIRFNERIDRSAAFKAGPLSKY